MQSRASGRGFTVFSKTVLPRHELDLVLPVSGSSVASIQRVKTFIETGVFPGDEEKCKDTEEMIEEIETESDSEEVEDDEESEAESKSSFTSSVEYPFTFSEVAFLLWKLYQCADRRYHLSHRLIKVEAIKDADDMKYKDDKKDLHDDDNEEERKERKKLLLKLSIENLSRIQSHQLNFISALSTKNKRRWVGVKNKVVASNRELKNINRNKEFVLMRLTLSSNMREFIDNEVSGLFKHHVKKRKKQIEIRKDPEQKVDTTQTEVREYVEESVKMDENKDEVNKAVMDIKQPKKEKKNCSLCSKEAIGKNFTFYFTTHA